MAKYVITRLVKTRYKAPAQWIGHTDCGKRLCYRYKNNTLCVREDDKTGAIFKGKTIFEIKLNLSGFLLSTAEVMFLTLLCSGSITYSEDLKFSYEGIGRKKDPNSALFAYLEKFLDCFDAIPVIWTDYRSPYSIKRIMDFGYALAATSVEDRKRMFRELKENFRAICPKSMGKILRPLREERSLLSKEQQELFWERHKLERKIAELKEVTENLDEKRYAKLTVSFDGAREVCEVKKILERLDEKICIDGECMSLKDFLLYAYTEGDELAYYRPLLEAIHKNPILINKMRERESMFARDNRDFGEIR